MEEFETVINYILKFNSVCKERNNLSDSVKIFSQIDSVKIFSQI